MLFDVISDRILYCQEFSKTNIPQKIAIHSVHVPFRKQFSSKTIGHKMTEQICAHTCIRCPGPG